MLAARSVDSVRYGPSDKLTDGFTQFECRDAHTMQHTDSEFTPVILGTGINAYGIARALHQQYGVTSIALGRAPLRETSHSKIIEVRTSPAYGKEEELVTALQNLAREFAGKKLILLPTIEAYTTAVLRHREVLVKDFLIPLVSQELAQKLINKADFYATCAELGIPHPVTLVVSQSSIDEGALAGPFDFEFPVILKPSDTELYPGLNFPGQKKIYLCDTPEQLIADARKIYAGGYVGELIVQEYLAGDERVMHVANTYSDQHGLTKYVSIAQIVLAEHNPKLVGNMNAVVTVDEPQLAQDITRLLDSLGYVGPANFDVMYDARTNTHKLLELNIRQGAASYYATATGHNLPALYVRDLVAHEPLTLEIPTNKVFWRNTPTVVAFKYIPAALKALAKEGRKNKTVHTLWYSKDLNVKRVVNLLKHEIHTAKNVITSEKFRINK